MIIDTNDSCLNKANDLKAMEIDTVGRYYRLQHHPEWAITPQEAKYLSAAGFKLFMVYEDWGQASDLKLTKAQGAIDGAEAVKQATAIGQPLNSAIYFAVERLPHGYKTPDLPAIRDYFAGVTQAVAGKYQFGVYGDGIVCKTLKHENIVKYTWLAAASTSFEGTVDFAAGWTWSIAQLGPLDIKAKGLSIDINVAKADFGAFSVPTAVS